MPETLITPEGSRADAAEEPKTQLMSADDFTALEDRILRAVNVVRRERQARGEADDRAAQAESRLAEAENRAAQAETRVAQAEARAAQTEDRATQAEARHSEHGLQLESLERDVKQLRAERDQVRERVERLLKQLDNLEL